MEFSNEFIEKIVDIFKHKFEFALLINKDQDTTFKLLNVSLISKKREKLYPLEESGLYSDYLNNHIYKYIESDNKNILNKFLFNNLAHYLNQDSSYSFDCDFILNKEKLNKKFSFFDSKDSYIMLVEDNTKYKVEQILDTLKSIDNASLLFEFKNDAQGYHIKYVSDQFAKLVDNDIDTVYKLIEKNHPFEFVASKDVNKISELIYGNEENGFHTSFIFDLLATNKTLSVKANISYYLLGKKLYCNMIFEDVSDILKLNQVTIELNETKEQNKVLYQDNLTDPLTLLGNEARYKKVVASLEEKIKNGFKEYAVCSCDVNGLKHTNDTYGHDYGCSLIVGSGHVFPNYFKTSELFHIGGDEFVLIILGEDFKNFDDIIFRLRNILEYQPFDYNGVTLHLSVAIGSSKYQEGDTSYYDAFHRADHDMYAKKSFIKKKHHIEGR